MRAIHAISAQNNKRAQEERRTSCCEFVCCDCSNTKPRAAVFIDCVCVRLHEASVEALVIWAPIYIATHCAMLITSDCLHRNERMRECVRIY